MKRMVIGAVAVLALAGTSAATAADMPLKAPAPAVIEVFTWTGFYAGLNAGGFWGEGQQGFSIDDSLGRYYTFGAGQGAMIAQVMGVGNQPLKNNGFTGGGQVGYNYQTGPWVLGLEADLEWFNPSATSTRVGLLPGAVALPGGTPVPFQITDTTSGNWLSTFRARAGIHPLNNLMLYGTAGVAVAHVNLSSSYADGSTCPPQISCALRSNLSTTQNAWGFAGGGGAEWAFGRNWSFRAEYLLVSVRGSDVSNIALPTAGVIPGPGACPPGNGATGFCSIFHYRPTFQENIVRVGINYRFDWSGPVVARY
jgi:outer membrane immunogenic protein